MFFEAFKGTHDLLLVVTRADPQSRSLADHEHLTLSHCHELRELEISVIRLSDVESNIISSVTSINIEKIILSHAAASLHSVGHTRTQPDNILIKLIERPKY